MPADVRRARCWAALLGLAASGMAARSVQAFVSPTGRLTAATRRYVDMGRGRRLVARLEDEDYAERQRRLQEEEDAMRPVRLSLSSKAEKEEDKDNDTIWELSQSEDGKPRFRMQPQFSAFEDVGPVVVSYVKGLVDFAEEGTRRRQAQFTILSVAAMASASVLLFLALLPAGFIHRPDPKVTATRPTYKTKTYIDPDKVLEDDFYRPGGVYMYDWANEYDEDEF